MTPRYRLILVEPQGPQNIGFCARLCANFGIEDFRWVRPLCDPRTGEAIKFATGGSDRWIRDARSHDTLGEALSDAALAVAFCGKEPNPQSPPPIELSEVAGHDGPVALVFGNERTGLQREDVAICDRVCRIPTGGELDSLNLSHAVAIALSHLCRSESRSRHPAARRPAAPHREKEAMYLHASEYLRGLGFSKAGNPARLLLTLRRMLDRAEPRANEVRALRAIFSRGLGILGIDEDTADRRR